MSRPKNSPTMSVFCTIFLCVLVLCTQARADEDLQKRVQEAVKKGVEHLKSKQHDDGSWTDERLTVGIYTEGFTALCGYTLVKAGEPIDSECVKKALGYLKGKPLEKTYSVSTLIMFLSALAKSPTKDEVDRMLKNPEMETNLFEPPDKRRQKEVKKLPNWTKKLLKKAIQWLVSKQEVNIWRYPGFVEGQTGPREDASNTQYAMFAFHCANQVGISGSRKVFMKLIPWFLVNQDQSGPKVKSFPIPAADFSIKKLKNLQNDMLKEMRKQWEGQVSWWKIAKKTGDPLPDLKDPRKEVQPKDLYEKHRVKTRMRARGWSHIERSGKGITGNSDRAIAWRKDWTTSTGSMTAAGIVSLIIAKSQVEKKLKKSILKRTDQAIRDGFAWLAHNWTVKKNPKYGCWHIYYLNTLQRAAILGLVDKIGEHNWYQEGAEYLVGAQQSNGSWKREDYGAVWGTLQVGVIENTCMALLFLLRATTPLVEIPEPGGSHDLFGPKKKH